MPDRTPPARMRLRSLPDWVAGVRCGAAALPPSAVAAAVGTGAASGTVWGACFLTTIVVISTSDARARAAASVGVDNKINAERAGGRAHCNASACGRCLF